MVYFSKSASELLKKATSLGLVGALMLSVSCQTRKLNEGVKGSGSIDGAKLSSVGVEKNQRLKFEFVKKSAFGHEIFKLLVCETVQSANKGFSFEGKKVEFADSEICVNPLQLQGKPLFIQANQIRYTEDELKMNATKLDFSGLLTGYHNDGSISLGMVAPVYTGSLAFVIGTDGLLSGGLTGALLLGASSVLGLHVFTGALRSNLAVAKRQESLSRVFSKLAETSNTEKFEMKNMREFLRLLKNQLKFTFGEKNIQLLDYSKELAQLKKDMGVAPERPAKKTLSLATIAKSIITRPVIASTLGLTLFAGIVGTGVPEEWAKNPANIPLGVSEINYSFVGENQKSQKFLSNENYDLSQDPVEAFIEFENDTDGGLLASLKLHEVKNEGQARLVDRLKTTLSNDGFVNVQWPNWAGESHDLLLVPVEEGLGHFEMMRYNSKNGQRDLKSGSLKIEVVDIGGVNFPVVNIEIDADLVGGENGETFSQSLTLSKSLIEELEKNVNRDRGFVGFDVQPVQLGFSERSAKNLLPFYEQDVAPIYLWIAAFLTFPVAVQNMTLKFFKTFIEEE